MLLAVYGTLRKGGGANVMLKLMLARYIGRGIVRGYKMFSCRIPFAVKSGDPKDRIIVEVYDVPEDKIPLLDYYESGYERKRVEVEMENGETVKAWLYEWKNVDILKDCELVRCGDWVEHIARKCDCYDR